MRVRSVVTGLVLAASLIMSGAASASPVTPAITNAATAQYTDLPGHTFTVGSNTVTTTVAQVGALTVTPKETAANPQTESAAQNVPASRTYTIANTGNVTDAYTVTATSGAGSVTALAFAGPAGPLPAVAGSSVSPPVAPGGTIAVTVTVAFTGVAVGTSFPVDLVARSTATTTVNGPQTDGGRQFVVVAGAPTIGGAGGSGSQITKTVDSARAENAMPGASVTYEIAFENFGASPATNAYIIDQFPVGIHPDPAKVALNGVPITSGVTLSGQTMRVPLGSIVPNVAMMLAIGATVDPALTLGSTYVNIASFGADGIAPVATTPAAVFVGSADIVYDGMTGQSEPIDGAIVSLLDTNGKPLVLPPVPAGAAASANAQKRLAASVNATNANPFTTGPDGKYGFYILVPAAGTTSTFIIQIQAAAYLTRKISAVIVPDATGDLYDATLTSQDGQPLAAAGAFTLTTKNVALQDVFGLLGNLPMFSSRPITVTKTADKSAAAPGDRIGYAVSLTSTEASALGATVIADTLPRGIGYAPGTALLDGVHVEPVLQSDGQTEVWTLPALAPGVQHTLAYQCVMLPDVPANQQLTNTVAVNGTIPGTTVSATGSASVTVVSTSGAFSQNGAITGRVYADAHGGGRFVAGDAGIPGVRIVLEDGTVATTDALGRFSFRGVGPGMHVLRLDETSLPHGVHAFGSHAIDSERSPLRLLHGTLDGGMLFDVNFAVEGLP